MAFTVTSTRQTWHKNPRRCVSESAEVEKKLARIHYYKKLGEERDQFMKSENAYHCIKILIIEAARYELSKVKPSFRFALKQNWMRIIRELDLSSVRAHEAFDIISRLGLWFPDIPSPAAGRRSKALRMIDTFFTINQEFFEELLNEIDKLAAYESGRSEEQIQSGLVAYQMDRPCLDHSNYVIESRELHQKRTILKLGNNLFVS